MRSPSGSAAGLFLKYAPKKKAVRSISPAQLGHLLLLGAGDIRRDYFFDGEYNLVDLYEAFHIDRLRRLFCECLIFRMFACSVACAGHPKLASGDREETVTHEMFRSFYEYAGKEPTKVFFESMCVRTVEELKKQIVEPRWTIYQREYNRKGDKGFHVATMFGVFYLSRADLSNAGSEQAKNYDTRRGVVIAARFHRIVEAVRQSLDYLLVSESRTNRLSKALIPSKWRRRARFSARR